MTDSNKLKMRFKLHQLEFELEGKQEVVKEEFENFKSFITDELLPQVNINNPQVALIPPQPVKQIGQPEEATIVDLTDIPTLKDVKMRDLAKNETDWLLVYTYFASDGGSKEFTRAALIQLYKESGRYTESRGNGLSQYIKRISIALFIKATNDTDFILLEKGKKRVLEIFQGNSKPGTERKKTSKSAKPNKTTTKKSSSSKNLQGGKSFSLDRDLNLRPKGKESLKEFANKYDISSAQKQIVVIVYYFSEVLDMSDINGNHVYTGLDALDIPIPSRLDNMISQTKSTNGFLNYKSYDDISLSTKGRNAVKYDLIKEK